MSDTMKHFSIFGSMPPREHPSNPGYRQWRENKTFEVVAESAQKALQLCIERFPGIEIHSLQHRGKIEVIQQETP